MASKIATFRLPENLIQEIRSRAEATGRDRTAVVIEALKQAFGMPTNESRPATVEELQHQLSELEEKITTLTQQLNKITQTVPAVSKASSMGSTLKEAIAESVSVNVSAQAANGSTRAALQELANFGCDNSMLIPSALLSNEPFPTQGISLGEGGTPPNGVSQPEQDFSITGGKPDGTELQELTARIEQQARIFDLVLSASPDPICVVDRVGRFTYANLALAQLFGLPQRNILGKTWRQLDLLAELMESEPIDSQREVVFATRRPLTKEISYHTSNGVRDYECILSPILGDSNNVEAVICTARDVTERNQVEESLRESESNYRHLF